MLLWGHCNTGGHNMLGTGKSVFVGIFSLPGHVQEYLAAETTNLVF